jgi:hypothetical protein
MGTHGVRAHDAHPSPVPDRRPKAPSLTLKAPARFFTFCRPPPGNRLYSHMPLVLRVTASTGAQLSETECWASSRMTRSKADSRSSRRAAVWTDNTCVRASGLLSSPAAIIPCGNFRPNELVSTTPASLDGKGLGVEASGIFDAMVSAGRSARPMARTWSRSTSGAGNILNA